MAELTGEHIDKVLERGEPFCFIQVLEAKGSTPRDAGAMMMVGRDEIYGTIGGGSAEWVAINAAREFIDKNTFAKQPKITRIITLGPEIDQCCGGTLEVCYQRVDENLRQRAFDANRANAVQNILIFGAGHTGLALARALIPFNSSGPMPMSVEIIDTRTEYIGKVGSIKLRCLALPEEAVRGADKNSIFVVTTHDHSLDFLITAEALARGDAKYVGMIGSPTKRAVLKSWMGDNDYDPKLIENLHCPIGGNAVRNKQPEVIAALTVAEILTAIG